MVFYYRSGQYVSPYVPDGSILSQSVSQPGMMLHNQPGYVYETTSLPPHMGPVHGEHPSMQHANNRAHPQTVSCN